MNAASPRSSPPRTTVSTHILDTSAGRPARGVAVHLAVPDGDAGWTTHGTSSTDGDGRCSDFPPLPAGTTRARLRFDVEEHLAAGAPHAASGAGREGRDERERDAATGDASGSEGTGHQVARDGGRGAFFPEVTVAFRVVPGEHNHVPQLLNPYGYYVYPGS